MIFYIPFDHNVGIERTIDSPRLRRIMVKFICKYRNEAGFFKADIQSSRTREQADRGQFSISFPFHSKINVKKDDVRKCHHKKKSCEIFGIDRETIERALGILNFR